MSKSSQLVPISLTVQPPSGSPEVLEFSQESVIIGSGPSANVRLPSDDVSSIHAMIKNKGEAGVAVLDLGSEGGTEVNGVDVAGEHKLEDGDTLTVAGYKITVSIGGHVQADPTQPDRPQQAPKPKETKKAKAEARPAPAAIEPTLAVRTKGAATGKPARDDRPPPRKSGGDDVAHPGPGLFDPSPHIDPEIFAEDLKPEEQPSEGKKVLEVLMLWGGSMMDVAHLEQAGGVTIGDGKKNTFRVSHEQLPSEHFSLVRAVDGGFAVELIEAFNIEVKREGKIYDLESLRAGGQLKKADTTYSALSYRVGLHDRVAIKIGAVTFVVQYVAPGRAMLGSLWQTLDYYFGKVLAASLILHLVFFFAMKITPWDPTALTEDLFKNPNRFAKLILKEPDLKKKDDLSGKKGGAKHKDKEGKFGKKDKPKKDAMSSKKGAPTVDANKREKDRKIALNAGALGILRNKGAGAVSNVFGPGGLGTGMNNALGGLRGADLGDAGGAGGLGTRGTGPGGGGNALGIGGLGSGTGRGTGGRGDIDLGGRGKGSTRIIPGKHVVEGALSKEEIGRVIRRYLNQIKYCYEKELPKNPNLYGKVVVMFTIGGTGAVNDANVVQTSLNDNNVEQCVLRIIHRLRFPQPKGGGIVVVTYPFIFQQSGG
ncbi:MAG: AgmX/PglI C-terminal domain-containing protein [Pseudomonadota bacterium]